MLYFELKEFQGWVTGQAAMNRLFVRPLVPGVDRDLCGVHMNTERLDGSMDYFS